MWVLIFKISINRSINGTASTICFFSCLGVWLSLVSSIDCDSGLDPFCCQNKVAGHRFHCHVVVSSFPAVIINKQVAEHKDAILYTQYVCLSLIHHSDIRLLQCRQKIYIKKTFTASPSRNTNEWVIFDSAPYKVLKRLVRPLCFKGLWYYKLL